MKGEKDAVDKPKYPSQLSDSFAWKIMFCHVVMLIPAKYTLHLIRLSKIGIEICSERCEWHSLMSSNGWVCPH